MSAGRRVRAGRVEDVPPGRPTRVDHDGEMWLELPAGGSTGC